MLAAYLAAQASGQQVPTGASPTNTSGGGGQAAIASESEFVQATSALARGLHQFGLTMGECVSWMGGGEVGYEGWPTARGPLQFGL